ncbi:MAG TPA: hypothetical protein VFX92_00815 [Candidatus Krumholzibacteria bacterium]|nr:hypothetical protein [Candidatus Krumholzibacteria bacterium]
MKRSSLAVLIFVAASVCLGSRAGAQVFYSMPGARPVSDASPALGLAAGFGDNVFRLSGFGRFNASPSADFGLEFAYDDIDSGPGSDDTGLLGGGADFKYLAVRQGETTPVDAAVMVGAGFLTHSDYTLIRVPLGTMVSRSFPLKDGRDVTPFAAVDLIMDFWDTGGGHNSDVDVELRLGASAEIVDRAALFAAFHLGTGTMFFLGFAASL